MDGRAACHRSVLVPPISDPLPSIHHEPSRIPPYELLLISYIATNGGIRPDGTYYGVFDGSFTASVKYTGSTVKHFTPSTWKMGVARLANGVYTPTGDGTVKVEARDENGIKATDYFTYPAPRVCPA